MHRWDIVNSRTSQWSLHTRFFRPNGASPSSGQSHCESHTWDSEPSILWTDKGKINRDLVERLLVDKTGLKTTDKTGKAAPFKQWSKLEEKSLSLYFQIKIYCHPTTSSPRTINASIQSIFYLSVPLKDGEVIAFLLSRWGNWDRDYMSCAKAHRKPGAVPGMAVGVQDSWASIQRLKPGLLFNQG